MRLPIAGRSATGIGPGVRSSGRRCSASHPAGTGRETRRWGRRRGSACSARSGRHAAGRAAIPAWCRFRPGTARIHGGGDEVGVLTLPAEPGGGGEWFFHHRGGIDEHFHALAGAGDELCQVLQHALHQVMVVAVAGVDGDVAPVRPGERGQRIIRGGVADAKRHHAACFGPQRAGMGALVARSASQPMSPCCPAAMKAPSRSRASGPSAAGAKPTASKPSDRARSRMPSLRRPGSSWSSPGRPCHHNFLLRPSRPLYA